MGRWSTSLALYRAAGLDSTADDNLCFAAMRDAGRGTYWEEVCNLLRELRLQEGYESAPSMRGKIWVSDAHCFQSKNAAPTQQTDLCLFMLMQHMLDAVCLLAFHPPTLQ